DLLEKDFAKYNAVTSRPEVHLHHTEARVGIARSGERYDVIQASLIDTWAATASGGFVLSENGLYRLDGWLAVPDPLTGTRVLTMTRWYVEEAAAETHRLVSLAAAALSAIGFSDVREHILLVQSPAGGGPSNEGRNVSTILASKKAFTADEIERLDASCSRIG